MYQNKMELLEKTHIRLLYLGILIDIFAPLIIFFIAFFLRGRFIQIQGMNKIALLFYVLLILSLGEIGVILIFRKKFWQSFTRNKVGHPPLADSLAQNKPVHNPHLFIFSFGIVIYALCLTPTLYGLVYYILGGTWERFALFVAITLLSFQLFKPRQEELEKLIRELKTEI